MERILKNTSSWLWNCVTLSLSVHTRVKGETERKQNLKWSTMICCWEHTINQTNKPHRHACIHRHTHSLFFLPPCTASGESSLYSRHREKSAPCDRPVSSSHIDLCGTSLPLFLLWWRDYVCSLPIRKVYSAHNGGPVWELSQTE